MKKRNRLVGIVVLLALLLACIPSMEASAKAKTSAPEYSGKWTYYSDCNNIIYKLNSQTGKSSKVKTCKGLSGLSHVSCYDGYLYFDAFSKNKRYIYRMKTNGKSLKKLAEGFEPTVYDKKIYFITYNSAKQIKTMSLSGKNKKTVVNDSDLFFSDAFFKTSSYIVVGGKLYYAVRTQDYKTTQLMQCTLKNKDKKVIKTYSASDYTPPYSLATDGEYLYYRIEKHSMTASGVPKVSCNLYAMRLSDNKITKENKAYGENPYSSITCAKGKIYFLKSSKGKPVFYEYNVKTNKTKTLKKNASIYHITFSKSGYQVLYTDSGIATMKMSGKSYKYLWQLFY